MKQGRATATMKQGGAYGELGKTEGDGLRAPYKPNDDVNMLL